MQLIDISYGKNHNRYIKCIHIYAIGFLGKNFQTDLFHAPDTNENIIYIIHDMTNEI